MATEKRYRVMNHDDYELDYIADSQHGFEKVDLYDCCDLLNENEQLKQENKKFQGKYDHLLWLYNGLGCEYDWLKDENMELKQRNNRQYEQLGRLYDLIEQKEWRVLTDIIDDFKKSDEQLQKERKTYGDVE